MCFPHQSEQTDNFVFTVFDYKLSVNSIQHASLFFLFYIFEFCGRQNDMHLKIGFLDIISPSFSQMKCCRLSYLLWGS